MYIYRSTFNYLFLKKVPLIIYFKKSTFNYQVHGNENLKFKDIYLYRYILLQNNK